MDKLVIPFLHQTIKFKPRKGNSFDNFRGKNKYLQYLIVCHYEIMVFIDTNIFGTLVKSME